MSVGWFMRSDGARLQVVPGFRERVLAMPRTAVRPTLGWDDDDFAAAVAARIGRIERMLRRARRRGLDLDGARLLELGCGPGIDAMIAATLAPAATVVAIDRERPLFAPDRDGRLLRRLATAVLSELGIGGTVAEARASLPVAFEQGDVTRLPFADASFDFCWSDAVLEHVSPIDTCFAEMSRVMKPGALAFHRIDAYFWLKGCHRRGLVDIPWAHARLSAEGVVEAAQALHGRAFARRCAERLAELNRLTTTGWREVVERSSLVVVDWRTRSSAFAEDLLAEFPEVTETLLPGIARRDLFDGMVQVWLARH